MIYQISMSYRSDFTCNIPSDSQACQKATAANFEASDELCQILDRLGLIHAHAYAWVDGSLYRYVEFEGEDFELQKLVDQAVTDKGRLTGIDRVYKETPVKYLYKRAVERIDNARIEKQNKEVSNA